MLVPWVSARFEDLSRVFKIPTTTIRFGAVAWLHSYFGHRLTSATSGFSNTPLAWRCWRSVANTTESSTSRDLDSQSLAAASLKWPARRS